MGEEVGTSVKVAISMSIVVAIVSILVFINALSREYGNKYAMQVNEQTNPKYEATLKDLCFAKDTVPAVSIYASMCYCEGSIAQITYDVNSTVVDYNISNGVVKFEDAVKYMIKYFHKKFYVRVVQDDTNLLHVWVGDYPKTTEGWVLL